MGDIWPYGKPAFIDWTTAFNDLRFLNLDLGDANVGAAIGEAESGFDYRVINDTPATGDYSVGIWQINYYGSLYASRTAAYGTPKQLVAGGAPAQAIACVGVFRGSGWTAWSTYNSGAYLKFLNGKYPNGGKGGAQEVNSPDPFIKPPTGDYSDTVYHGAAEVASTGNRFAHTARALRDLRK